MGWERRGRSGTHYYYRVSRMPDGKVVKQYLGGGARGRAAAAAVARAQAQRAEDRRAVGDELVRLANPDVLTAELVGVAQLLLEATMLAKGFHRLNYGKWRKRRGEKERS